MEFNEIPTALRRANPGGRGVKGAEGGEGKGREEGKCSGGGGKEMGGEGGGNGGKWYRWR